MKKGFYAIEGALSRISLICDNKPMHMHWPPKWTWSNSGYKDSYLKKNFEIKQFLLNSENLKN